jgi:hypothetical protein
MFNSNGKLFSANSVLIGTFVCTMSIRTRTTRHFARCYLNVPKGHTEVGADEAGPINWLLG